MIYVAYNDGVEYLVDTDAGTRTPVSQVHGGQWDTGLEVVGDNQFVRQDDWNAPLLDQRDPVSVHDAPSNVIPFTPAPAPEPVAGEPELPPLFMPTPDENAGNEQGWFDYPDEPVAVDPGGIVEPAPYIGDLDIGSEVDRYREPYLGDLDIGSEVDPPERPWYEDHYGMGGFVTPPPSVPEEEDDGFSIFGWTPPDVTEPFDDYWRWQQEQHEKWDQMGFWDTGLPGDEPGGGFGGLVETVAGSSVSEWLSENKWLVIGGAVLVGVIVLAIALR